MAVFVKDVSGKKANEKMETLNRLQKVSPYKLYIYGNNIVHDMVKK